jgi:hypothetical protein
MAVEHRFFPTAEQDFRTDLGQPTCAVGQALDHRRPELDRAPTNRSKRFKRELGQKVPSSKLDAMVRASQ